MLSFVPFAKYMACKHKPAKTADLWVKLQKLRPTKQTTPVGVRGAPKQAYKDIIRIGQNLSNSFALRF